MESQQHPGPPDPLAGFVQVGVVSGAHGFDGRLRIQRDTDNPGRFRRGAELWIGGRPFTVLRTGGHGENLLVQLTGVDTREDAAALLREPVLVPSAALAPLPQDTYYHYQLIGMRVMTGTGEAIGSLTEVISTGANDVYVVTGEGAELLLPAIGEVIQHVDVDAGIMTVAIPDGLEWRQLKPPGQQPRKSPKRRKRPARRPPLADSPPNSGPAP